MASKLRVHFHSNTDTGRKESLQAGSELGEAVLQLMGVTKKEHR